MNATSPDLAPSDPPASPWTIAGLANFDPAEDADTADDDMADDDRQPAPKASVTPFDRLPVAGVFGMPPLRSLYHTKRAADARRRAKEQLPAEMEEALGILIKARVGRDNPDIADVADHNVMTLAYALAYARCGLHVIDSHAINPLTGVGTGPQASAKLPRGSQWQTRATTDPAEIVKFWTGEGDYPPTKDGSVFPYARVSAPRNVSIAFPEGSGLFVVDIDGDAGKSALADLIAKHGDLPRTAKSITGSGGWHFIFRTSRPLRNTASAIAPGVDIRGQGGQIIAAPSIHKSGNFYRWEDGCAPWDVIEDAPDWLVELAYNATKTNAPAKLASGPRGASAPRTRSASTTTGFANLLALIGDGDGEGDAPNHEGFDAPIYRAACSWWAANPEGDADELFDILREVIKVAPRDATKDRAKYDTDAYLNGRIEQARAYIGAPREQEADDSVFEEDARAASLATVDGGRVSRVVGRGTVRAKDSAADFEPVSDWLPSTYRVENGVIYRKAKPKDDDEEEEPDMPLTQVFDVVGRASNVAGDAGAGRTISFLNENRVRVEATLNMADLIADSGGGVLERLADAGMRLFIGSRGSRQNILNLFRQITPRRQIPTVPRPGWVKDRGGIIVGFLCPTGEYIAAAKGLPYRLATAATVKDKAPAGTLEGWTTSSNAAFACPANWYWTLTLSAAFAGPLLALTGLPTSGFNLSGESSKGKTLALQLGASVWGTPREKRGVLFSMNNTTNALEMLALIGSETFLGLDEVGAMQRPGDLPAILFGLSTGSGKSRMAGRDVKAGLSDDAEFLTFAVLTNERPLRTVVTDAGGDYKTGLSVRFPDLDVTAGARVSAEDISKIEGVKANFGHAGPAFVRWLIAEGWHLRGAELRKRVDVAAKALAGDCKPAQARASTVFALVQVAGGLACDAGLLSDTAAVKAAVSTAWETFKASDEGRATEGDASILDGFRSWLVRSLDVSILDVTSEDARTYRDKMGWYDEDKIVLLHASLDMKAMGLNGTLSSLLAALDGIGALERSGKNRVHNKLSAGMGGGSVKNVRLDREKLGLPGMKKGTTVAL